MALVQLTAFFDLVFAPLLGLSPALSLLIVSSLLTALVIVINMLAVNRKVVREIKDKLEGLREQVNQAQKAGNKEDTTKYLNEMMKTNGQYMRQTFKALIVSMVILGLFLPWLQYRYANIVVAKLPFVLPYLGSELSWFWWYVFVSLAIGWALRKIFVIDYA